MISHWLCRIEYTFFLGGSVCVCLSPVFVLLMALIKTEFCCCFISFIFLVLNAVREWNVFIASYIYLTLSWMFYLLTPCLISDLN